jgi:hypothetical protein
MWGSSSPSGARNGTAQDAAAVSSDEEDDFVYNPLKLPMGWDGKPIPYWLYKLHGLNQVPSPVVPCASGSMPLP